MLAFHRLRSTLVSLFLYVMIGQYIASPVQAAPDESSKGEQAWKVVLAKSDDAAAALKREQTAPMAEKEALHEERVKKYLDAAEALRKYMIAFPPKRESVTFLREHYRLGVFYELGEKYGSSELYYSICIRLPAYHDSDALFDDARIDVLVPDRLKMVDALLHPVPSGGGSGGGGDSEGGGAISTGFVSGSFKGSIIGHSPNYVDSSGAMYHPCNYDSGGHTHTPFNHEPDVGYPSNTDLPEYLWPGASGGASDPDRADNSNQMASNLIRERNCVSHSHF